MRAGRVHVLGPLHITRGHDRLTVGGDTAGRLLASLVAAGGTFVGAGQLAEQLWGAEVAGTRLRMAVSRVRARLAEVGLDEALVTMSGGYRLDLPVDALDATAFEQLVRDGRDIADVAPRRAIGLLEDALALWGGEPFSPFGGEPWLAGAAQRLTGLRLAAEEELADLQLRAGLHASVVDRLTTATDDAPLRERRWVQLATALGAMGRRSEALRAIDGARRVLGESVGLDVGRQLLELEQQLLEGDVAPEAPAAPWGRSVDLFGRDAEQAHLRRLLRTARVVTVVGLGGVGKSALASALASELEQSGVPVLRAAIDAISSPLELRSLLGAAVGISGTDDPDGLIDAIARHTPRGALWVLDGVESSTTAVMEVVGDLVRRLPSVRFVLTSRVPVPIAGASVLPLEPLPTGTAEDPGPAMWLFSARAGVVLDAADALDRGAVERLCLRAGGLPLAVELLAAASERGGLHAIAGQERGTAPGVGESVRWALDALPAHCREAVMRISLLSAGVGPALGADLAGVPEPELVTLLGPAVQGRLLHAVPSDTGHRYLLAEPIRQTISDGSAAWRDAVVHAHMVRLARSVGPLHGPADAAALARVEEELDNLRHWSASHHGASGLELTVAMARAWTELGLAREGSQWIEHQLASTDHPPASAGAARIAAVSMSGVLDVGPRDYEVLDVAVRAVEAAEDWTSWLLGSAYLTVACGWVGDYQRGFELMVGPQAQERLDLVGDPWFRVHRRAIIAVGPAARGNYRTARANLDGVAEHFLELGDASAALDVLAQRTLLARIDGDWEGAEDDLRAAESLMDLGLARGTVASLRLEATHIARARGDRDAPDRLASAIDELERAGLQRRAAANRRDLGAWLAEDGETARGWMELQGSLPTLLRTDRRGAAIALAELAALAEGDAVALLAGAAEAIEAVGGGVDPAPAQAQRLRAQVAAARAVDPDGVVAGRALDDAAIMDLVSGDRGHAAS